MNNVYHKKWCNWGTNPAHVEPPPIPLIKEICNGNPDKYFIKLKLCRDYTSSTLNLYNFKMSLFDHGNLTATGKLEMDTKIQYLCTLVRG